jgi:hypothetical protein
MSNESPTIPAPLFRDPVFDGAADPTVIWNRAEKAWWIVYTNRRASAPAIDGVGWVHGTDLGVASSTDGGYNWLYRGVIEGLDTEWGRHTYWAPEIVDDGTNYHMYVSVIRGVPTSWYGVDRQIRHYASPDLVSWTYQSTLELASSRVIDACVYPLPGGGWRMWYKNEDGKSHTWYAESDDLYTWRNGAPAVTISGHEGPNVFRLGGYYWMVIDEWKGQRVLRSTDLSEWVPQVRILDEPGNRDDDAAVGLHADVVVDGERAAIFYFTHPARLHGVTLDDVNYSSRRSSLQVARVRVVDGALVCDRNEVLSDPILPIDGPSI